MPLTTEQLVEEARHWPPEKVGELLGRLAKSFPAADEDLDEPWKGEARRRLAEIEDRSVRSCGRGGSLRSRGSDCGAVKPRAFHPAAAEEYSRAAEYYTGTDPELGRRFHDEIERLFLDIPQSPAVPIRAGMILARALKRSVLAPLGLNG